MIKQTQQSMQQVGKVDVEIDGTKYTITFNAAGNTIADAAGNTVTDLAALKAKVAAGGQSII